MNLWLRRFLLWSLIVLVFPASAAVWDDPSSELWKRYNVTVADSAVYRHENLRRLHPLKFDPQTFTTTVVTLTNYAYPAGVQTLSRAVWVTAVPEVQEKCTKFPDADLAMRLRQLVGLQPDAKFQYFVTMTVRSSDIFRPATDPTTTIEWPCSDSTQATCGEVFPNWVSSDHVSWIANQMLTSYVISAEHNGAYSYPWTRLGYTYDWKPGADRYGASEYVIRPGSVVNVTDKKAFSNYCGRN
ncbi:MAG TPA: hypothetical protein VJA94_06935 [Candidatus Angelobacter sp.]